MKNLVMTLVLASYLTAGASYAEGQSKLSPNEMSDYMAVLVSRMLQVYSSPEMATMQAKFYKSLYDALQKEGFSKEEAMQIVVSQGNLLGASSN